MAIRLLAVLCDPNLKPQRHKDTKDSTPYMKINQRFEVTYLCLCVFVIHFLCYR